MEGRVGPVTEAERIRSLDVLRGFALLGILVMNVQSFAMPFSAYTNPTNYGDLTGVNFAVWLTGHLLVDQKFITIFSMLFGAGIVLMTSRLQARGERPARWHYRRMLWLLLIGLLHAYALWYGDILYLYALGGMVVYPCRKWKPRTLLVTGIVLIAVACAITIFFGLSMPRWPQQEQENVRQMWTPSAQKIGEELQAYRGGWLEQMKHRVPLSFQFQTFFMLMFIWRPLGLMLMGMALYKLGVFAAERSSTFYGRMVAAGFLLGVPLVGYGAYRNFAAGWALEYSMFYGMEYNYWGSLLVSLGWVGVLMLVCKSGALAGLTHRLAAVGQMAFTNYLLHTLLCTTIFYGHGLGWFGSVPRVGQILIVFAIWALQLIVSPLWLRHYQMGPFEWVWRSLTYGAPAPFRRGQLAPSTA